MDVEIKRKWIEALRSGKYVQGKGILRNAEDHYCCLGVLCDIVNPNGWAMVAQGCEYSNDGSLAIPGEWVCTVAEISESQVWELVDKNDVCHFKFNQIADFIEERL